MTVALWSWFLPLGIHFNDHNLLYDHNLHYNDADLRDDDHDYYDDYDDHQDEVEDQLIGNLLQNGSHSFAELVRTNESGSVHLFLIIVMIIVIMIGIIDVIVIIMNTKNIKNR